MREIKFRYRFRNRKTDEIITQIMTISQVENRPFDPDPFDGFDFEVLSRDRYIGRKDRNGKEIYEKDIVGYKNEDAEYRESIGIGLIQSDDHSHCVSGFSCRDIKTKYYVRLLCGHPLFSIEVIGTIYENPEFLKENKE